MISTVLPLIILFSTVYLLLRKIGDTTHVDLNTLRGDEWDDIGIFTPIQPVGEKVTESDPFLC